MITLNALTMTVRKVLPGDATTIKKLLSRTYSKSLTLDKYISAMTSPELMMSLQSMITVLVRFAKEISI